MQLNFFKMQAQGNDYLFFDFRRKTFPLINFEKLAIEMSNRHFGIGSDGIVLILDDATEDVFMRIFNADGTEANMCGSALRCVTAFLHSENISKVSFQISTLSGTKSGEVLEDGKIKVNLGMPQQLGFFKYKQFDFTKIDIGNAHSICFVEKLEIGMAKKYGKICEEKFDTNIEFVKIISSNEIDLQVWERGSGITLACGTGSAATVFAGIKKNLLENNVMVNLPGGKVEIEYKQGNIFLIGDVSKVFEGIWDL